MKRTVLFLFINFHVFISNTTAQDFVPGQPLPPWQEGYLDLHHINTGRGSAAYYIFPDGTTMLVDAGEMNPLSERVRSPRNSVIRPDSTRRPYEWIAHYITQVAPQKSKTELDYALITHFHDDHFGSWYDSAPLSSSRKYVLTGIAGLGELIPIHHLLDRGYPGYNYPVAMNTYIDDPIGGDSTYHKSIQNYFAFVQKQRELGRQTALFKAGSRSQIILQHKPKSFPDFYVQNIKANGLIWTGKDSTTVQHFPPIDSANKKTWKFIKRKRTVLFINQFNQNG